MLERPKKGRIYTFYSYKGGVGRSMTLANIAALMTKLDEKVLIVDWDLEAPGLELFFNSEAARLKGSHTRTPGVVDLLYAKAERKTMDWHTCLLEANILGKSLSIISAGERNHDYQSKVQHIDWDELFEEHDIGNYIDELRNQWTREYDFVLIDSRTGITDIGDICTVLLPDVLVLLFVSNYQNIFGIKNVMERATKAHKNLPVNRSRLIGVPVPCRDEVYNEYDRSQEWKEIFAEELGVYYNDWLPRGISPRDALNKLFIPYVANWSFGERLPVVENENEIQNPTSLSAAYSRLAKLLTSGLDWNEMAAFSDPHELSQARIHALDAKAEAEQANRKTRRLIRWGSAAMLAVISISLLFTLYYVLPAGAEKRSREAWQTITQAQGQRATAGRIEALEYLSKEAISLAGVDISKAYLQGLNVENADLSDANVVDTNLTGANLAGADLTNANLARADLAGAYLAGADLSGADLSGADLTNIMDWQNIKSLKGANIYGVKNAPDGFEEWAGAIEQGAVSAESQEAWWDSTSLSTKVSDAQNRLEQGMELASARKFNMDEPGVSDPAKESHRYYGLAVGTVNEAIREGAADLKRDGLYGTALTIKAQALWGLGDTVSSKEAADELIALAGQNSTTTKIWPRDLGICKSLLVLFKVYPLADQARAFEAQRPNERSTETIDRIKANADQIQADLDRIVNDPALKGHPFQLFLAEARCEMAYVLEQASAATADFDDDVRKEYYKRYNDYRIQVLKNVQDVVAANGLSPGFQPLASQMHDYYSRILVPLP